MAARAEETHLKKSKDNNSPELISRIMEGLTKIPFVNLGPSINSLEQKVQCDKCNILVPKSYLKNHVRKKHLDNLNKMPCHKCPEEFENAMDLDRHLARFHSSKRPFKCEQCDKSFYEKRLLSDHVEIFHEKCKSFRCKICNETFKSLILLKQHERNHVSECLVRIENLSLPSEKLRLNGETNQENVDCQITKWNSRKTRVFSCRKCIRKFRSRWLVNYHLFSVHKNGKYCCTLCAKLFSNACSLIKHERQSHGKYECKFCRFSGRNKWILKLHTNMHFKHKSSAGTKGMFKFTECVLCEKSFQTRSHYLWHVSSIHCNRHPFKCAICKMFFTSNESLEMHLGLKHTKKKTYKCRICLKLFGNRLLLHSHRRESHRNFFCFGCYRSFNRRKALKVHRGSALHLLCITSRRKGPRCAFCERDFQSEKKKEQHELFECDYRMGTTRDVLEVESSAEFSKTAGISKEESGSIFLEAGLKILKEAEAILETGSEVFEVRSKVPEVAEAESRTNGSTLLEEMNGDSEGEGVVIVSDESLNDENGCDWRSELFCDICYDFFSSKKALKEHVKVHEECSQCKLCSLQLHSKNSLLKHLKLRHTAFLNYVCVPCDEKFQSSEAFDEHLSKHFESRKIV